MKLNKKIDLTKYKQAIDLSFSFYKEKYRKGIKFPYFSYLSSVSNLIIENNGNTDEAIASLFHDIVEFEKNNKLENLSSGSKWKRIEFYHTIKGNKKNNKIIKI